MAQRGKKTKRKLGRRRTRLAVSAGLLALALASPGAVPSGAQTATPRGPGPRGPGPRATTPAPPAEDTRQLVSMPAGAQRLLRQDMLGHLIVLNQLLALLGTGELEQAATVAETGLGVPSMGRHRGTGMGPGRFMPPEMHKLGMSMHQAASEFAEVARAGDAAAATAALQRVTTFCVACHAGYRIR